MNKVTKVTAGDDYRLDVAFDDGVAGTVDLSHLAGRGVFTVWQDYAVYRSVRIGERGDLQWPDGIDLCADALYLKVSKKPIEDVFPELTGTASHA